MSIPNHLIISSIHIQGQSVGSGSSKYRDIFALSPELFDKEYPYEPCTRMPFKKENEFAEYFQVALFLLVERFKGEESFWKPFLDY